MLYNNTIMIFHVLYLFTLASIVKKN